MSSYLSADEWDCNHLTLFYKCMHVAVPPAIVGPSSFVWSVEALEFGVCTHLELLNASVHLSLNKDSSDSMNS